MNMTTTQERISEAPLQRVGTETKTAMLVLLNTEFDRLNQTFFENKLRRPVIEFSTRKSFGGYYQKLAHRIVLSWQAYVEYGLCETMNTFRHEVAHIVHQHHRKEFWQLAYTLGVTKKYASVPVNPVKRKSRWYTYECPACKGLLHRKRRIKNNASCAKCDSEYNPLYQLRLIKAETK
jgi:predicted SprT family Zn-dependent metalloprotease